MIAVCPHTNHRMSSEKPFTATGIERVINAARYSIAGFKSAFANEAAFRQELGAFAILAPLGFWLGESGIERALLVGSLLLVLIVELLNSAIENIVDRVSDEHHVLAGRAKDQGSAAVALAIAVAALTWIVILIPRWFD